jgi:alpha-ketoglutarate-dependent taurine dioxygenase
MTHTAIHPEDLPDFTGPIVWQRDTLAPEDGLLRLSPECVVELLRAVETLRANPLPVEVLAPDLFDLPACWALMADAKRIITEGLGFVIVDRLPMDRISRDEAIALYWLLGSMLARPVAQNWRGWMVYDVQDTGKKPGNGVRPDVTNVEQNFHTDNSYNHCPPHILGLLCLQTAKVGGISRIVSFPAAHIEMKRRHPDLLPRLYRPFHFDRQREHAPGDDMTTWHPLFALQDGVLVARLSRFQVMNGYKLAGEEIDPEGRAALEAFEAILNDPAMWKDFYFEPGQMQFLDNRRCGHKRTGFEDWPEPERKRRLVRLWLRDTGRPFYNG